MSALLDFDFTDLHISAVLSLKSFKVASQDPPAGIDHVVDTGGERVMGMKLV